MAPAGLYGQERPGRQRGLDRAQIEAIRAEVRDRGGRAVIGFKPRTAEQGMRPDGRPALSAGAVSSLAASLAPLGVSVGRQYHIIPAVSATLDPNRLEELLARPEIDYVEPDYLYEPVASAAATAVAAQNFLDEELPWGVERIDAMGAWGITRGAGAKVGIVDTGIDEDHPDLVVIGGVNFVTEGTDRSDWDDTSPFCRSHGTHVAGTVAALDNEIAVVGVAPEAELYALRVFDPENAGFLDCLAESSNIIAAIEWAVDNGLDVINMSFGRPTPSLAQGDALFAAYSAGVVPVAAAGNNRGAVIFPAAFPHVIAVSATDEQDDLAVFSSRGPEIDVSAPGVHVLSTQNDGTISVKSGTSMASPHVVGVAALIRAARPDLRVDDVRQIIRNTAEDLFASGYDEEAGWGIVDAAAATASVGTSSFALSLVPGDLTLAIEPGGAPVTRTVEVRNVGASGTIGWSAAADASWLRLNPTAGSANNSTPGLLQVTVDPAGLDVGLRTGFVTLTGNAANSPVQLRVRLAVAERVPLDPGVATAGVLVPGDRLRYVVGGAAGQRIDIALLSDPGHPEPLADPLLRVYRPDGEALLAFDDDAPFAGIGRQSLVYGLSLPEDGDYQIEVSSADDASGGGFILKARPAGPILGFTPAAPERFLVSAQEGVDPAEFELEISNLSEVGSIGWTATPSAPWLSVSPSSGAAAMLTVTADPTGLAVGEHLGAIRFETSDGWLLPDYGIFFWVYSAGMRIVSSGHLRPWGMAADDTARAGDPAPVLAVTEDAGGSLIRIEPDGTLGGTLASGFNGRPGGLTVGRDGNWYVGSRALDDKIIKITRDGESSVFASVPSTPNWLTTGLAGDFYVTLCDIDRVYRVSRDGLTAEPFGPQIDCPGGIAYSREDGRFYVAVSDGQGVQALALDGSPAGLIAGEVASPAALTLGRSGNLYITSREGRIWVADPGAGGATELALAPSPTELFGVALAEGALMIAGTGAGQFYRYAVDDGPTEIRPPGGEIFTRLAVDEIDAVRGQPFRVPLRLDLTESVLDVASYSSRLEWPPLAISFGASEPGDFGGTIVMDSDSVGQGVMRAAESRADGASGDVFTLYAPTLTVGAMVPPGAVLEIEIGFDQLKSASGRDLLINLVVERARICVARYAYGDVTQDGEVSAADAVQIMRHAEGLPLAADADMRWGDVNADGKVGYGDAAQILRHVTGLAPLPRSRVDEFGVGACTRSSEGGAAPAEGSSEGTP